MTLKVNIVAVMALYVCTFTVRKAFTAARPSRSDKASSLKGLKPTAVSGREPGGWV